MERLLTRRLVIGLAAYDANGLPVTSVYLGLEPSREYRKTALVHLKDLVADNRDKIMDGRSRAEKALLQKDIGAFRGFLEKMPHVGVRGLAMYSSSGSGFFEQLGIAVPFRPQMIVAGRPAVAPLIAALDEYKRIAICLVDRRTARLYEYFMGRMEQIEALSDAVPGRVRVGGVTARMTTFAGGSGARGRVKAGGWAGFRESKNMRHIQEHEHAHFRNVAEVLFEQFKLRGFDWLFLGARNETREIMDGLLHPYVRERLKAYVDADAHTPTDELRKVTVDVAERLKAQENDSLVERLIAVSGGKGLAVTGLRATLEAVNTANVATLLIRENLSAKGVICNRCGTLGVRSSDCKACGKRMTPVDDVVEQAIDMAVAGGATVKRIRRESRIDEVEGIGALLRFPRKGAVRTGA